MDMENEAHSEYGSEQKAPVETTAPTLIRSHNGDTSGQLLDIRAWLEESKLPPVLKTIGYCLIIHSNQCRSNKSVSSSM